MAEFCKQCNLELFDTDYEDFAGLTTTEDKAADLYAGVLCESCGPILVDIDGSCISDNCPIHGKGG